AGIPFFGGADRNWPRQRQKNWRNIQLLHAQSTFWKRQLVSSSPLSRRPKSNSSELPYAAVAFPADATHFPRRHIHFKRSVGPNRLRVPSGNRVMSGRKKNAEMALLVGLEFAHSSAVLLHLKSGIA